MAQPPVGRAGTGAPRAATGLPRRTRTRPPTSAAPLSTPPNPAPPARRASAPRFFLTIFSQEQFGVTRVASRLKREGGEGKGEPRSGGRSDPAARAYPQA